MALGSDPTAQQIANEFGADTRNNVNGSTNALLYNLAAMYTAVFGGGNHDRKAFGGKEKATKIGNLTTSVSSSTVTLQGEITAGAVETEVIGQYQSAIDSNDNELAIPDDNESAWTTFVSTTTTTNGVKSLSGTVPNGRYFFRLKVYNGFISHVANNLHIQPSDLTERRDVNYSPPKWSTPTISSCSNNSGNEATAEWVYGESPSSFEAEIRINGGTPQTGMFVSSTNWGTATNNKIGTWSSFAFFNPGDNVEIRIRASAQGGTSASNWSGWCSSTA